MDVEPYSSTYCNGDSSNRCFWFPLCNEDYENQQYEQSNFRSTVETLYKNIDFKWMVVKKKQIHLVHPGKLT